MGVAEPVDALPSQPRCWCCGRFYPTEQMVRLGSHPEVTVCRACARDLHRRAGLLSTRTTPMVALRRTTRAVRNYVIAHKLHQRRLIGPLLRWLDNVLP